MNALYNTNLAALGDWRVRIGAQSPQPRLGVWDYSRSSYHRDDEVAPMLEPAHELPPRRPYGQAQSDIVRASHSDRNR